MALIICQECKNEVSDSAKACPKCGAKVPRAKLWLWIPLGLIVGVFVLGAITGPKDTRELAEMEAKNCMRNQGGGDWRASSGITLELFCTTKGNLIGHKRACELAPSKC